MNRIDWLSRIPEKQRYTAFIKQVNHETRIKRIPITASFELTPLCTLNCCMCYVRMTREQMESEGKQLTTEQWVSIAREVRDMGILSIKMTGGEAMIRDDYIELYNTFFDMGFRISVLTNGTIITPEILEAFRKRPPYSIQITLYGFSFDSYEKVCQNGWAFEQVMTNIQKIKQMGLPLGLATTISTESGKDYVHIHQFAKEQNIPHVVSGYLHQTRDGEKKDICAQQIPAEEIQQIENELRAIDGIPAYDLDIVRMKIQETSHNIVKSGYICGGGNNIFHITWKGVMQTCPTSPIFQSFPLEIGVRKAWEELSGKVAKVEALTECQVCEYKHLCTTCPAIHYSDTQVFGKVSPRICRKCKKTE